MPKPKDTLDRLNINTPCTANWDEMVGNDQVRFCRHCDLSVYNLSAMTRQEALRLVISSNGKLCARYIRRPDGVIHTVDSVLTPLHSIKRRISRVAAGAFSAALSVSTSVVAAAPTAGTNARSSESSFLLLKIANPILSGTSGASVTGVITDQNGAAIPGITVILINEEGGSEYTTTTDDEGAFRLQAIEEGNFKFKIEGSSGFATKEITGITLGVNDERTFDETLDVATESVTVGGAAIISPSEPLVAAVFDGDIVTVKELLANGANINVLDTDFDSTALTQAVMSGNREIVDILINAGADVNLKNRVGHTSLMAMSPSVTAEIVWVLIDAGAKTDLRDNDGMNALHYAASSTNPDTLRALLDAGASVDARGNEGRTALMIAAEAGNTENVYVLLRAGAFVNLRDEDETTALGLAVENEYSETAKVLMEFGAKE